MLRHVPEVSLLHAPPATSNRETKDAASGQLAWTDLEKAVKEDREDFLDRLVAKRPDLADLPFQKGNCRLDRAAARSLQEGSQEIRDLLATALGCTGGSQASSPRSEGEVISAYYRVCYSLAKYPRLNGPKGLPALEQILTGEPAPLQLGLVQRVLYYPTQSPTAASVLARRALFDTSDDIRQAAHAGLRTQSPVDYLPLLVNGLRYPWAPVNFHAADALVALGADAAVPELGELLDAPDPCAPFEIERDGKRVTAVRELVRLNHNANCLLCHAPSFSTNDLIRGPVPSPSEELPPRFSLAYYYGRGTSRVELFVRADTTYLRQDFSELLPVPNPGKWPQQQRFDFLVRVRLLTEAELTAWRARERLAGPPPVPASRQAVRYALQALTGSDGAAARSPVSVPAAALRLP
jgi:hypothetical protein